ncbi:unnamed protein product [Symbiodinium sp. CCMP2592]|nr:unnamed protein product [Symbiodinium sp. CCMP2592]
MSGAGDDPAALLKVPRRSRILLGPGTAAKRRASLSTATAAGMLYDAGSDSTGSTSTKASSGTPAKPKGNKLQDAGPGVAKTPQGPGKRVRAKMTPLPSAEKTPSTSTPLPKALKDATATPSKTPSKMHIEEAATPVVEAKKTLQFDEGTPVRPALKMPSADSLPGQNETPADVRYVRQLLVTAESDGSQEESTEDMELATQITKDLSELQVDDTLVDEAGDVAPEKGSVAEPVAEISAQAGAVEVTGPDKATEMSTQADALAAARPEATEMSTQAGENDAISEKALQSLVAKLVQNNKEVAQMLLRPNTVDFEKLLATAAQQSMPPPSYIPVKHEPMAKEVIAKALSEAATLPAQSSQAAALPAQSSQAPALPAQSSEAPAAALPAQTTETPGPSEPPTPTDSDAELLEAQAAAKEAVRLKKNQRANCPLAVMEAYGECMLPNGRIDKTKLNRLFDDWASHGEDWGETEAYAAWESKQLNRSKQSCRWLTRKELRAFVLRVFAGEAIGEWKYHPDFPNDEEMKLYRCFDSGMDEDESSHGRTVGFSQRGAGPQGGAGALRITGPDAGAGGGAPPQDSAIVQANANLLEISGFEHKLVQAGCDKSLVNALTESMAHTSAKISEERQKLEADLGDIQ